MRDSATSSLRQRRVRNAPSRIVIDGDTAQIEVSLDGTSTIIDAEDVPLVLGVKWSYCKGYVRPSPSRANAGVPLLHRLIAQVSDPAVRVDHIDGNPLNNRKSNLRPSTASTNGWNRSGTNRNNTSGVPGVSRNRGGWMAYLNVNRKRIHLGTFPTIAEAAAVRKAAELVHFGDFAPQRHGVTIQKSPARGTAGPDAPIVKRT